METQGAPHGSEEASSDLFDPFLRDPLGVLVRRWKPMLLGVVVVITCAVVVAARMEPLYSAQATVSVLGSRISENFVQTTVEIGTLDQINAIVSEVLSRKNLAQIALAHDLGAKSVEGEEPIEKVVDRVREHIVIEAENGSVKGRRNREASRVYMLGFKDPDSKRAAAVANALATSFIDVHLRLRSSEARVTTDFLRRELAEVQEELRAQERLATEFKEKYRGELPGELNANLSRLERLQENRRVLVDQLRTLESRPTNLDVVAADDSPEARATMLRTRLNEALSLYTPDHPNVVALQRQLEALQEEFGGSSGLNGASLAANDARGLRRRIREAETELAALDARVARTPKRQEEQDALDRNLLVLRTNYTELLRKVDQAELSESVESAQHGVRVSILDRAVPPQFRDASRTRVMLIGIGGALALAALVALLLESVDAVVINSEQIESRYAIPVIGNAPHIS